MLSTSTDTSNTAAPRSSRWESVSSPLPVRLVMETSTLSEADAPSVRPAAARADRVTSPWRRSTTTSLSLSAASAMPPAGRVMAAEVVARRVISAPSSARFTALVIWEADTEPPPAETRTSSPEPVTPLELLPPEELPPELPPT